MSASVRGGRDDAVTVLHVCESISAGVARHLTDLVSASHGIRHVVAVPAHRVGDVTDIHAVPAMRESGAEVHLVDMRRNPASPVNARAFVTLAGLVRSVRPDVVHGHSSMGGALGRAASLTNGAARVWTPNGLIVNRTTVAVERLLGRLTDRVVAVSDSEAELLVRLRIARPHQVVVIPNGVARDMPETKEPLLRERLGVAADAPLVGAVGRLVPQKAPMVFAAACAMLARTRPELHFLLVGSGKLAPAVDAAVATWDVRKQFHRLDAFQDVAAAMPQLTVLVAVSEYEGGPYVPLEAMRAGTPVVLSNVVGNRDAIEPGRSGLLVPPGDPAATAAAVCSLLDDAGLRMRFAAAGRERVRDRHDLLRMGRSHSALYASLKRQRAGQDRK